MSKSWTYSERNISRIFTVIEISLDNWRYQKYIWRLKLKDKKWRNVRNKIMQIKGVELKSPLNIKYEINCVCGGIMMGFQKKNYNKPVQK